MLAAQAQGEARGPKRPAEAAVAAAAHAAQAERLQRTQIEVENTKVRFYLFWHGVAVLHGLLVLLLLRVC
jgi:hypothetical protein